MHFNNYKIYVSALLIAIGLSLGFNEYRNKPLEYAKEVLDFVNKSVVLLKCISPVEQKENEKKTNKSQSQSKKTTKE